MTKTIILTTIFLLFLYSLVFLFRDLISLNEDTLNSDPVSKMELNISKLKNGTYDLKWKLKNSKNISHFLIQKSTDEKKFSTVGRVECDGKNKFSFQEDIFNEDITVYRVVSVFKDGTFTLSENLTVLGSPVEHKYQ